MLSAMYAELAAIVSVVRCLHSKMEAVCGSLALEATDAKKLLKSLPQLGSEYKIGPRRLRAATRDPVNTLRSVPRGKRGVQSCDEWLEDWIEKQTIPVEPSVMDRARELAAKMRARRVG